LVKLHNKNNTRKYNILTQKKGFSILYAYCGMHVLRHTVWEREDDVLVKRVHGTLFYTTLQAIPTGTSASTFASIITTNALIALTPLVCHQERLFACKKSNSTSHRVPPPHGDPAC